MAAVSQELYAVVSSARLEPGWLPSKAQLLSAGRAPHFPSHPQFVHSSNPGVLQWTRVHGGIFLSHNLAPGVLCGLVSRYDLTFS